MSQDYIDPALRAMDNAATQRIRSNSYQTAQYAMQARPGYYNPASQGYHYAPVPVLSQTQQIQKLFEQNPSLQQAQSAANKAAEAVSDEEGEELDDEQLADSNAQRENLQ